MKMPRFKVSFLYMTKPVNGSAFFGNLEPRLMNYGDLEYMLKMISPMTSNDWLDCIDLLRRGSTAKFVIDGYDNDGIQIKKMINITRN